MKKCSLVILVLLMFTGFLAAQSKSVNRNTAVRHLKLAENCLVAGDWDNAVRQAELGLSYDNNISDLIYIKAAAEINLGKSRAEILKLISVAFEKNDWVGYKKNGARILYADLLSDTGCYEQSLELLDKENFIYSADAEFIRIKNYYRLGDEANLNNARLKLNSARRIYPSDLRFPNIFFLFEYMIVSESQRLGIDYEIPELVKTLASYYVTKLPDYTGHNTELEILASFFAEGEEQTRLVAAIDAKDQTVNPLIALAGLKTGIYTDQQAYDIYFSHSEDVLNYTAFANLCKSITDMEVKNQLMDKMLNFNGTMLFDENFDLQNELEVTYEIGRPQTIRYDRNNDGVTDLYITCDFGVPSFVYFNKDNTQLFYGNYPEVSKISFITNKYNYNFLEKDYYFSPVELNLELELSKLGLEFYVPVVKKDFNLPENKDLLVYASSVSYPINERTEAYVDYTTMNGKFVYATFYENADKYAACDFTTGLPFVRSVDYDNDGYFETSEVYDVAPEDSTLYEKETAVNIFGTVIGDTRLYLKKVQIDRNANTFCEFSEQYMEKDGKICMWDNDDNGIWDCQYIRYPTDQNNSVLEETIYFDDKGNPYININTLDGIPVKMISNGSEVMIYSGNQDNLYWIEMEGTAEMEAAIKDSVKNSSIQGNIVIVALNDTRISVIKVGKNLYCKVLPDSEIEPEEETAEENK